MRPSRMRGGRYTRRGRENAAAIAPPGGGVAEGLTNVDSVGDGDEACETCAVCTIFSGEPFPAFAIVSADDTV